MDLRINFRTQKRQTNIFSLSIAPPGCVRGSRFFLGGGIANSDKMSGLYTNPREVLPVCKEQVSTGVPVTGTNRSIGE